MNPEMTAPVVSPRLVRRFVDSVSAEVGVEKLSPILSAVELSPQDISYDMLTRLDGAALARVYAAFQQSLRLYYGHGARGILLRVGRNMWERITMQANLLEKAELEIARRLPVPARRRRVLDLVAGQLREGGGAASIHTLDLDLLLADHSAAATVGQSAEEPICFVTLGLIEGALSWATGQDADVEEISCKATGASACEFRIKLGGK